jgi:hypothetical protein
LIWSQARPGFVSLGSFFLDRKSYMHPRWSFERMSSWLVCCLVTVSRVWQWWMDGQNTMQGLVTLVFWTEF